MTSFGRNVPKNPNRGVNRHFQAKLDVDVDEKYERRRGASLPASSISKDYYTII